mgnify:CR=1 FL=1
MLVDTFLKINFLDGGKIINSPKISVANPGKIKSKAAKARATENEAFRYIYGDGTEQNKGNGNLGPGTMDGKKYNSFQQYQREFVKQDDEFAIKQVVPEINSISEMKALVKISGGLNNLSDETIALMDERLAQL